LERIVLHLGNFINILLGVDEDINLPARSIVLALYCAFTIKLLERGNKYPVAI